MRTTASRRTPTAKQVAPGAPGRDLHPPHSAVHRGVPRLEHPGRVRVPDPDVERPERREAVTVRLRCVEELLPEEGRWIIQPTGPLARKEDVLERRELR